jgi:hypothetical protein
MKYYNAVKGIAPVLLTVLAISCSGQCLAQGDESASDAKQASPVTSHNGASTTAAERRAQRKAARKEAREKRNAELKKLEDAGYKPAQSDPNFPQRLQDAQKKAGATAGASQ